MNIITKDQSDMIDEILLGRTVPDIAKNTLKLSPSTLYRWLDKPEVKAELEVRRQQVRKSAKDRIIMVTPRCIDNIVDIADNCTDPRVKLQANKYLVDQGLGSPSVTKEDSDTNSTGKDSTDKNTLKEELKDLKSLKVIK